MKPKVESKQVVTVSLPVFPIFVVFFVLKVTGTVAWSWLWVTSPLWLFPATIFGLFFSYFLIFGTIYVLASGAEWVYQKVRR